MDNTFGLSKEECVACRMIGWGISDPTKKAGSAFNLIPRWYKRAFFEIWVQ
jgi:hypothetical protein